MLIHGKRYDSSTKSHIISLTPEIPDDIYTLYNIIDIPDKIESSTSRKIEIKPGVKTRVTIKMCLKSENIDVDLESSILFVKGRTLTTHEHVPINSYHTIEIMLHQKLTIYKQSWSKLTDKCLQTTNEKNAILFIIMKQKEFILASATANAIHLRGRVDYKGKNYKPILTRITADSLNEFQLVIVASCYDSRTEFRKYLSSMKDYKKHEKKVVDVKVENDNMRTDKIIGNILQCRENQSLFSGVQFCQEIKVVSLFLRMHNEGDLTCVGFEQIRMSLDFGALKTFLVTNTKFKSNNVEERRKIEKLSEEITKRKINIYIIPAKHSQGEMLNEMGGIGGILKYNCFL